MSQPKRPWLDSFTAVRASNFITLCCCSFVRLKLLKVAHISLYLLHTPFIQTEHNLCKHTCSTSQNNFVCYELMNYSYCIATWKRVRCQNDITSKCRQRVHLCMVLTRFLFAKIDMEAYYCRPEKPHILSLHINTPEQLYNMVTFSDVLSHVFCYQTCCSINVVNIRQKLKLI